MNKTNMLGSLDSVILLGKKRKRLLIDQKKKYRYK